MVTVLGRSGTHAERGLVPNHMVWDTRIRTQYSPVPEPFKGYSRTVLVWVGRRTRDTVVYAQDAGRKPPCSMPMSLLAYNAHRGLNSAITWHTLGTLSFRNQANLAGVRRRPAGGYSANTPAIPTGFESELRSQDCSKQQENAQSSLSDSQDGRTGRDMLGAPRINPR